MSEDDNDFMSKKFNASKEREMLITQFKKFIDKYDFKYMIDGELELENLKDKIKNSPKFSLESNKKGFKKFFNSIKYKNLLKGLDKFIRKNKEKYFFRDNNSKWILNRILREYSKVAVNNAELVRTSLFVDSEYKHALDLCLDLEKYSFLLSIPVEKE